MNGARSTFMRKGYWLTALAAAVLLAASSWDGAGAERHFLDNQCHGRGGRILRYGHRRAPDR